MNRYLRFCGLLRGDGWHSPAWVTLDPLGCVVEIADAPKAGVVYEEVNGFALPGFQNAHSHAFQYAMAGSTEHLPAGAPQDDFWSWREAMYRWALALSPEAMEAIATMLYAQMLRHGITAVAEFHYLHHNPTGAPYADVALMGRHLLQAAKTAGIRITLIPIFYQRGGFGMPAQPHQRRFVSTDVDAYLRLLDATAHAVAQHLSAYKDAGRSDITDTNDDNDHTGTMHTGTMHTGAMNCAPTVGDAASMVDDAMGDGTNTDDTSCALMARVGVGVHSLRAVRPEDIVCTFADAPKDLPRHIHVAEQQKEVADCLTHLHKRPIEWLLEQVKLDERTHLVHATHATKAELQGIAKSGAHVVLCPSTEGNLGDGLFPLLEYLQMGGLWSIGTDSHIRLDPCEDLRWLDYGQRIHWQRRNPLCQKGGDDSGTLAYWMAYHAGRASMGSPKRAAFAPKEPFDAVVYDAQTPLLALAPEARRLSTILYTCDASSILGTIVQGKWVVYSQHHRHEEIICARFFKHLTTVGQMFMRE